MIRDRDLHSLWARARVGGIPSTLAGPDRGSSALAWCIIACRPVYQENRDVLGEKARSLIVNVVGAGLSSSLSPRVSFLSTDSLSLSFSFVLSLSFRYSLATRRPSYLLWFKLFLESYLASRLSIPYSASSSPQSWIFGFRDFSLRLQFIRPISLFSFPSSFFLLFFRL